MEGGFSPEGHGGPQGDGRQEEVRGCWHIPLHLVEHLIYKGRLGWAFISIPEHLRGFAKLSQQLREEVILGCSSS